MKKRVADDPLAPFKEILIGFAALGSDNADMVAHPEVKGMFRAFEKLLKDALPHEVGFVGFEVRIPELILKTETGEFPIDGASGGLMSVMQVVWQIFLYTKSGHDHPTIILDEPENHLHPSLQREFLRNLVGAFPQVQFIVATHSPFIVSSVKDANVYALKTKPVHEMKKAATEGQNSRVFFAQKVELQGQAGTATQVLSDVLGVPVTLPIWAEKDLERIVQTYMAQPLTQASLDQMKQELQQAGLGRLFLEALAGLVR
ncbi:MAG: AAA family ATPase [Planktomarina sp.]